MASRRRPSTPSARKRSRQRHTVGFDMPVRRIVSIRPRPESSPGTMRARQACFRRLRGWPGDLFEALALPVRKPGFPSCRFPAHLPCLPFCWPLATAAGERYHASERNGIACFKSSTSCAGGGTARTLRQRPPARG